MCLVFGLDAQTNIHTLESSKKNFNQAEHKQDCTRPSAKVRNLMLQTCMMNNIFLKNYITVLNVYFRAFFCAIVLALVQETCSLSVGNKDFSNPVLQFCTVFTVVDFV